MHSIRFKISAITIAAILTTALCVVLASFYTFQTENNRQTAEMMNLIAHDTEQSLEKYTENIEQSVEMIGHIASDTLDSTILVQCGVVGSGKDLGPVGGEGAGNPSQTSEQAEKLAKYLTEYDKNLQKVSATVASHTYGIITYYYCINPQVSTLEHGFFYSRVGKTGFAEREQLDARELDPSDIEHTTWYYTPIKRGRPSWVGPYTAHFLDEMTISSYLVPIYKSGQLIGVLGMDIPIDTMVDQVSSIRVFETGFAFLLDADGRVLYHPELEFGDVAETSAGPDVFKQESNGNELIRYTAGGEERLMAFTTLSNGMKLAVTAPTSEVNASLIRLTGIAVPATLLIIVLFTILILAALNHLTRPLVRLTAASQQLANADYDVQLDYESRDEVGVLTGAFEQMRDQLKERIEELRRMALTDDLTGLPNQRHFFELAQIERDRLAAEGKNPAMLYFNLVGMKHYNHQFGFEEGDRLMSGIAEILAHEFGWESTGRFGQDHFAAVTAEDQAEEQLAEVFAACREANGGNSLPLSVGIYRHSLDNVNASVACDRAKYACDQRGKSYTSGFRYFDEAMLKQVENKRYVINNLDRALNEKWVQVHYQPIVHATNGQICDEEALSRWNDPELGQLLPVDFIPALENASLIYRLDLFVLDQVLEKISMQTAAGMPVVPQSINLSRSDFDSCDIVEEVRARVDAAGIERSLISIEITESVIGRDFDFMKEQIERFQSLGFPVWMDDFGTGYSSLDVLRSIHFDLIKFDMSFLYKLDESENGKIILTDMARMTTTLGVDTICEGVETESQYRFLQSIGVSKLQGYYFGKPAPFE